MPRYSGIVGFAIHEETSPGVWTEEIKEVNMRGDIIKPASRSNQNQNGVNNDLTLGHRFSLLGDAFSFSNFSTIRYLEYMGVKWSVTSIEINRPRLILNIGGVYVE